jgi:hypothetical protein
MEKINIFVPVYFRKETVMECAEQLVKTCQSDDYDVRLIFVDNKSDDELRQFLAALAEKHPWVTTRLLGHNKGKGSAINEASKKFDDFDWFINCDSDIFPMDAGWPGILADCFKLIHRAGMLSTDYMLQNNPMPKQPKSTKITPKDREWDFQWGGQVAGGCFLTSADVWKHLYYRCSGVYGGVDGVFRQNVAGSLMKKCGFLKGLLVRHMDDRKQFADYHKWKMGVQNNIRAHSPLAPAKRLGNDKGFYDK